MLRLPIISDPSITLTLPQKETEAGGIEGDRCNKQLASVSSKNLVNNIGIYCIYIILLY